MHKLLEKSYYVLTSTLAHRLLSSQKKFFLIFITLKSNHYEAGFYLQLYWSDNQQGRLNTLLIYVL